MKKDYLKSSQRIENTFILFEYLDACQDDKTQSRMTKRFVRLRNLLSDLCHETDNEKTVKFMFVINQYDHLYLPEFEVFIAHIIQKNKDFLMLKTKIRLEKTGIDHEILSDDGIHEKTSMKQEFHRGPTYLKSLVNKVLTRQDISTCLLQEPINTNEKKSSLDPLSYRFKITNPNIDQLLLNNLRLSPSNSRSLLCIFGRYATVELEQHEDKSNILILSSKDVGVLKYLKNFIATIIFGHIKDKSWKVETDSLKALEVSFSPELFRMFLI